MSLVRAQASAFDGDPASLAHDNIYLVVCSGHIVSYVYCCALHKMKNEMKLQFSRWVHSKHTQVVRTFDGSYMGMTSALCCMCIEEWHGWVQNVSTVFKDFV